MGSYTAMNSARPPHQLLEAVLEGLLPVVSRVALDLEILASLKNPLIPGLSSILMMAQPSLVVEIFR